MAVLSVLMEADFLSTEAPTDFSYMCMYMHTHENTL